MSKSSQSNAEFVAGAMKTAFGQSSFQAKSYGMTRRAGSEFLLLRPCDTPWREIKAAYCSGKGVSYTLANAGSMVSERGESFESFSIRCAAAGKPPDFLMEDDENGNEVRMTDLVTSEDVTAIRAAAIERKAEPDMGDWNFNFEPSVLPDELADPLYEQPE